MQAGSAGCANGGHAYVNIGLSIGSQKGEVEKMENSGNSCSKRSASDREMSSGDETNQRTGRRTVLCPPFAPGISRSDPIKIGKHTGDTNKRANDRTPRLDCCGLKMAQS